MGLLDSLGVRSSDDQDDDQDDDQGDGISAWAVAATQPDNNRRVEHPDAIDKGEWRWDSNPPDKKQFLYDYGHHLEESVRYALVPYEGRRPDFDNVKWSHVEEPEFGADDELRTELQELRAEIREGSQLGGEDMEEQLIALVAQERGPGTALQELKQMKAIEQSGGPTDYFADADLGDEREVATAALMNLTSNYGSVGEAVEDVIGGALSGAMDSGAVGPAAGGGNDQPDDDRADDQHNEGGSDDGDEWSPGTENVVEEADRSGSSGPIASSGAGPPDDSDESGATDRADDDTQNDERPSPIEKGDPETRQELEEKWEETVGQDLEKYGDDDDQPDDPQDGSMGETTAEGMTAGPTTDDSLDLSGEETPGVDATTATDGGESKQIPCPVCGEPFKSSNALNGHRTAHSDEEWEAATQ